LSIASSELDDSTRRILHTDDDEIRKMESRIGPMMAALPARRTFLVMVSDETDSEASLISGRVEHIESGRRVWFSSRDELSSFVDEVLKDQASATSSESDRSEQS
jgi:hypothetical protein